jgi:hypothetical protein
VREEGIKVTSERSTAFFGRVLAAAQEEAGERAKRVRIERRRW